MPGRILVVDDSLTIRRAFELILRPKGYELDFAVDGGDALARAAAFAPDLILLDYVLPDMRGPDVCAALAATPASAATPVVLVSAKGASIRQAYRDAPNIVSYITKPFKPAVVEAVIEKALTRARHADERLAAAEGDGAASSPEAAADGPRSPEQVFSALLGHLEDAAARQLCSSSARARADLGAALARLSDQAQQAAAHLGPKGAALYRLRPDGSLAELGRTLHAIHRSVCDAALALAQLAPGAALPAGAPRLILAASDAHPRARELDRAVEMLPPGTALRVRDGWSALPALVRLLEPEVVAAPADEGDLSEALAEAARHAPARTRFVAIEQEPGSPRPLWAREVVAAGAPVGATLAETAEPALAAEPQPGEMPALELVRL